MKMTRRGAFGLAALGVAAPTLSRAQTPNPAPAAETPAAPLSRDAARSFGDWTSMTWPKGIEGQRLADLGDGTFLNPILAGDHPDPSILKDGDTYYMTHSSFESVPGLTIWSSKDLVN